MDNKNTNKAKFVFEVFVSLVMAAMVLMIFVNACLRYLFSSGIAAFEELSRYAFVWVATFGTVIAYYADQHVGVDMLVKAVHGLPRLIIQLVSEVLIFFAIAYILCYGGYRYFAATLTQDSAAIPVPLGVITISPLVMGVAMLPKTLLQFKKHLKEYQDYKAGKEAANK